MLELALGSVFSGHRIEGMVGRGGMGVVYRAQQITLGRTVALKVIAPELLDDQTTKARFLREARAAASVEHPHVIPVLHADEEDGVAYLVMRYVDGDDVRTLVRRTGPLAPERAARIAAQTGEALDAIHAAGFVHRDVKPANVLLARDDHVYVSDFGLAKETIASEGRTRSGQWVGTLDFVAPEQIRGERVDARTDVYALGGLLFYMLTAKAPFSEQTGDEAKLWAHLAEAPSAPSRLRPGLPATFDGVTARALAKAPADRYPSAGDVGRAALAAAHDEGPAERERIVAVGAAAPASRSHNAHAPIAPDAPTADALVPMPAGGRRRASPRWALLAGAAATLAVAGAITAAVLAGGSGGSRARTATRASETADGVRVGATIDNVGRRPNAIAVARGAVWVSSAGLDRVARFDAVSGRRLKAPPAVGRSVIGMATAGDEVWVAFARPGRVVRIAADGSRITGTIPLPRDAIAIDSTPGAVWVAVRGARGVRDSVLRYDPNSARRVKRVAPAAGARAIAAAPDGVWIAHRSTPTVAHVDGRTGREGPHRRMRHPAYDLAYGAGYAWASLRTDNTVVRISPGSVVEIAAPQAPMGVAVSAGRVFVAGFIAHAVGVIDPRSARPVGRPIAAGLNPFAITGDGHHVWVTSVGSNSVTRLDLS